MQDLISEILIGIAMCVAITLSVYFMAMDYEASLEADCVEPTAVDMYEDSGSCPVGYIELP